MTSTNDGKDVKSNQTSGHKSKSYYIELYTSLEKALSSDNSLEERTKHVCEAWRRVYSLYQHSATSTHPHLLSWLQRHTANTVLQSKWAKSKNEHARLTEAIDALVVEATAASAGRPQHPWEQTLLQRAAWFRKASENPWDNPVLKSLINPDSEPVTDQQVLEWLISEHGIVLVTRLQRMIGAGNCDDLALLLASAVMDRARAATPNHADEWADEKAEKRDETSFVAVLEREASFTADEWEMLTDIELVLLLKTDKRPRCIELAKLTPLRLGYKMVERLRKRLETSPRDKKLWKHAKEVATIVTQVLIARCMVLSTCAGAGRDALYWCARSLARLVEPGALRSVSTALAAPAATARHLHTFCAALSAECKELKTDVIMKPFICELYVRAITAGMNELEQLKLNALKESDARLYEQTLAGWFTQLGGRLTDSVRLRAECALTAFSVHPARKHYERVATTQPPHANTTTLETKSEPTSEYGSWANDSRTQSNLVKTSETLQLKQSQQHQANVLSTAILTEGEALGLEPELCQDLAVLLSGPRVKTLSWDMDRDVLLQNCRAYMEKTHGGTRAVTTELKFLNLDPNAYQHLPEEDDDENDVYYGIEKGYEHEVQFEEPEEIWQNAFFDPEQTESANDSEVDQFGKKKSKAGVSHSEDEEDPLSTIADAKKEKKKKAKEQKKKKTHKRDESNDGSKERRKDKDKDKKPKKERKNKSEQPSTASLTSLLGMKIAKVSSPVQDGEKRVRKKKERRRESTFSYVSVTDNDNDSQGKLSHDDPNVLVDGVFSMDELKSPERVSENQKPIDNTKATVKSSEMRKPVINELKTRPRSSSTVTTSSDSDAARAKSPYLTPNQLAHKHLVNPTVKSSLHKLLQFRRNQNKLRAVARPAPARTPTPTLTANNPLVGLKVYNPEEVPKVYLNKKQSKQLEALSNDVNSRFRNVETDVMPKTSYNEACDNKLHSQQNLYNTQKCSPQYTPMHIAQNMLNESLKLTDYTTQNPAKVAQQSILNQSPTGVIQTNYASPTKPDVARPYAVNLTPSKPTITYQPLHKSMQNLSTDKLDVPKKPLLINDPNYFSQQHFKASQLSPKILSNTIIKPPIQTTTAKNDESQMYSNLHRTYSSKPVHNINSQKTNLKSDVIRYGQKQLSSSMQNITEMPGSSHEATRRHIPTPSDMLHGPASQAKLHKVISHCETYSSAQVSHSSNSIQTSRSNSFQTRDKIITPAPETENNDFDEFLLEIVKSIHAGNKGADKNVTVALNKDVKLSCVQTSSSSKRTDLVTPQSAKQQLPQKKSETAPNTFSRLNYMHKNKQNESKVQLTDTVTLELNKKIIEHKISKAKYMKNEVTISKVGMTNPNAQDTDKLFSRNDQSGMKLKKNCPLLSSMLESTGTPNFQTYPVATTSHNSAENQPNREDADLLLLLRHQTILKPNLNTTQISTSEPQQSILYLNSQTKVETQSTTQQALVGTKVKNIDLLDTCTMKKEADADEWKRVMDAIRAQKTEPLGPNALDLALKKDKRRHSQTSARTSGKRVGAPTKKRGTDSSKANQTTRKPSTEKHSLIPKTPREAANVKKVSTEMFKRIDVPNKHSSSIISKETTHVATIPNSEYDMLDDLIDDDLRRELGEISSDEETYCAQNVPLAKGKSNKNIPKSNVCKAANMSKEKPHGVNPKAIISQNQTNLNITDSNIKSAVNTSTPCNYSNMIINNSSHPCATHVENRSPRVITETLPQYEPSTTLITNQVAQNTANNIMTHIEANQYINNIVPANVIIASVPQPAPVVVIRQDLVYDPYPTIRIHESQVNAELCAINQNVFAVNTAPNIAVYQTTQFAAPVINPIIIGNATTTTNVSDATAMGNEHVAPDLAKEDLNMPDEDNISLETALRLSDAISETSEPPNLDFNMNRNCERKVLSQVHENHKNDIDKESHISRLPDDGVLLKSEQDEERIKLKRQSLINRNISHAGGHPPIALSYAPLSQKVTLGKLLQQDSPKNGTIKPNLRLIPNITDDIVELTASVQSPTSELNNENIVSTNKESKAKENQKSCRRIWLRSSNTISNKKVSPVKRPRIPLKRKTRKPPITDGIIKNITLTNLENVNKGTKITKRTSKRILIKNKLDTNKPSIPKERREDVVDNDELIDFEKVLDGSIVLKSTAAMLDKSMQEPAPSKPAIEQCNQLEGIQGTEDSSQSNTPIKNILEPMVVIEKLKSQLGSQLVIKSTSDKTSVKKASVITKNQNLTILSNKNKLEDCAVTKQSSTASNRINEKVPATVHETAAAAVTTVPLVVDTKKKLKPMAAAAAHQEAIKQNTTVSSQHILDKTNKLKLTLADSSQLLNETNTLKTAVVNNSSASLDETRELKSTVLDDQIVIEQTLAFGTPLEEQKLVKEPVSTTPERLSNTVQNHSSVPPETLLDETYVFKSPLLDDLKVTDQTSAFGTPLQEQKVLVTKPEILSNTVDNYSSDSPGTLLDEAHKLKSTVLDDQKVTEQTSAFGIPLEEQIMVKEPVATTSERLFNTLQNHSTDSPEGSLDEAHELKSTVLDDQKVTERTLAFGTPPEEHKVVKEPVTTTPKRLLNTVDNHSTDSPETSLDKAHELKSTVLNDQKVTEQTLAFGTPLEEQSVVKETVITIPEHSNTVTKEVDIENNKSQISTMIPSLVMSDPVIKSKRTVIALNADSTISTNAESKINTEPDPKAPVKLPAQECSDVDMNPMLALEDDDVNITEISEAEVPTKTKDLHANTEILKSNPLDETASKDQQKTVDISESLVRKEDINNDIQSDKSIANENVLSENLDVNKCRHWQLLNSKQSKMNNKGSEAQSNNFDGSLQTKVQSISINSASRKRVSGTKNKKKPATYMKGDIKIEEIPLDDPDKKSVRILLPNGKTFRATIFGKMQGDFDSLFADPKLQDILARNAHNDGTRYTLNYKQVRTTYKDNPTEKIAHIKEMHIKASALQPVDTVNLISDDEDEVQTRSFNTEFGEYNTNLDKETIDLHQKKFDLRSKVKMLREDLFKSNRTKPKSRSMPSEKCSLLTRNKSKLQSVTSTTPSNIAKDQPDSNTDVLADAKENLSPLMEQANTSIVSNKADVIEIDDSSNDSIENQAPEIDNKNVDPVKIAALKNSLLHDLGVATDKDKPPPIPAKCGKAVVNLTSALLQDLGIVPTETPLIDITDNDEFDDIPAETHQPNTADEQNIPVLDIIRNDEDKKIVKLQEQFNLKKCDVPIEKCDKLAKTYDLMKKMKHCYVVMERLNNLILQSEREIDEMNQDKLNAEDFIEFDVDEQFSSPQLSRCPSLSILNDWGDQPAPESPYCTSPVMEIYDTLIRLRNKLETQLPKGCNKSLSSTCDSEWTMTKFGYKSQETLLASSNLLASENQYLLPVCDSLDSAQQVRMTFETPKLLKIVLNFLEGNPNLLCRWEMMLRKESTLKINPSSNTLKRKTDEDVEDEVASKVIKLGTLALNSLNSGIQTFIKSNNLKNMAIPLDTVENSDDLIISARDKYKITTAEDIKRDKQTNEISNTDINVQSEDNNVGTRPEETMIIIKSEINCKETQDRGNLIENTETHHSPAHEQSDIVKKMSLENNIQENTNRSVDYHTSVLKDVQNCVPCLISDIDTFDEDFLADNREVTSPSLLSDYIEFYEENNENTNNVVDQETVKGNISPSKGIVSLNSHHTVPLHQHLPVALLPTTKDEEKLMSIEVNCQQSVSDKPSESKEVKTSVTCLPGVAEGNEQLPFSLLLNEKNETSVENLSINNEKATVYELSPFKKDEHLVPCSSSEVDFSDNNILENNQEITSQLPLSDNYEISKVERYININENNEDPINDLQVKDVEYSAASSIETDRFDDDFGENKQQISSPPPVNDTDETGDKNIHTHNNIKKKEAANNSSLLKEIGRYATSPRETDCFDKNITYDHQEEMDQPSPSEITENDNIEIQKRINMSDANTSDDLSELREAESSTSFHMKTDPFSEELTEDSQDEMSPPPLSDNTETDYEDNQIILSSPQSKAMNSLSEIDVYDEDVTAGMQLINTDLSDISAVNGDVSHLKEVDNTHSCATGKTISFGKDVNVDSQEVNSPVPLAEHTETEEKGKSIYDSKDDLATDTITATDIKESDKFDEIFLDDVPTEFCEVVITDDYDDLDSDVATDQEIVSITKEHASEIKNYDSEINSPDFIDSKKITFNYHDYTKLPKNNDGINANSMSSTACTDGDITVKSAPVSHLNIPSLKEQSNNDSYPEDIPTCGVDTIESYPLKSKPECKYELIQEDDMLTVKIISKNHKEANERKMICVGPNDIEEDTVVALPCSNITDDINLKGYEFEDVYVFPLSQAGSSSSTFSNDSLAHEPPESISESVINSVPNDLHNIDFHVIEPKITYSRKRKISMRDVKVTEKKYRKGKNIDCSKQTQFSMVDLAYSKEYKRLLEYCSSVKFSYSRPFHKECVELEDLTGNWPINGVCCGVPGDVADKHLFVNLENFDSYQPDPETQTFVEEISYDYNKTVATPDDPETEASETNFNMGFGEGSGRVIQIWKKGGESNISAATLSDVKQSQPVFKSVDPDYNEVTTNDQIKKIRQQLNFIELRDKVRQFFKKSAVELKYDWMQHNTKDVLQPEDFPFGLCSLDYVKPLSTNVIVQVVQVGQLPVSAAAQNPVTCDPRVTQVSNASPSQCSAENSPNDDSQSEIKTEYTELTTADLTLPLQEYAQQNQTCLASQDSNVEITEQTISLEMEIKAEESPEIKQELPDIKEEKSNSSDTELHTLTNETSENVDYSYENNTLKTNASSLNYDSEQNSSETFSQQRQQNGTTEKTDQIAHAMNAAGINTTPETVTNTRAHALVNILSQKIRQGSVNTTQTTTNTYSKTSINAMALQQALAQILPPPLNQTGSSENNQTQSTSVGPQVLHIVQGKNASGNQITLVDNSQQSVISTPNATQVLHIVQNKNATSGHASNGTLTPQANSFSGLSLVDAGLQQGGNQLLHIVNTGNQKTANPGQLLKRVNLLTNLTNVQGSNEQKMVQFVCKSADGKAIQLNAPHQRSMVLRLQPIETPNVQNPPAKPAESQEHSPSPTRSAASKDSASQQEIKSRSIYEENYAKFIQNSSSKTPGLEKSTSLPKFNQAFGKPVFQEGQKQGETPTNNSHLPSVNTNSENAECPANDNAINLEHMGNIASPPLLIRKPVVTTTQSQSNIVQQIKQTIAPMNIQTMHGGVIYTRQIPVNIGGGQTINLITVPSTELINDDSSKSQAQNNQGEIEPSIIKIVPQTQTTTNIETSQEESNNHASGSNENAQTPQPQPVLTQMRIKLPMLSKAPQMVPGARVVRPSFFQIQRNVIGGANQPVYQQLVLTAAPPLGQQTIRLPSQASRPVKVPSESQSSSSESQMSSSTLEQLREFDMVLEQVKERSTSTPSANSNNNSFKIHTSSSDTTDGNASSNCSTESTPQVLYSIGNNQSLNVAYVNRKTTVTTPTTSTYVRSPDSSGIADSPTSSTHVQIAHTVTTDSSPTEMSSQSKSAKVGSKSKSRPKSTSNPPNTLKLSTAVPPKTSSQKPLEDEQTTQRILYILAEYKEQVENSPDKDKPAPRRRSNPPSNPGSSKRKKSSSSRRSGTRDMSPVHGEDTCRTMGSEDSSCGTSQGDCTESCLDSHSPQDSPRKVARKITFDQDLTVTQPRPQPQRNVIVADGQTITVARGTTGKPATAVLMPANYILPVSMVKGGQQIAIVTNRGPKLLTVGGEGGATNALLLQRLIGPAGLKPVLARPGVRHVRLPTAALHNLQAFNLATATTVQPPDSTASPTPGPTPPELVDTRATSSPWTDRDEVKPERSSSPEGSEPWNLPSSDAHEYTYEETVRTDNMDRTVLVVQKKDGSQRQHRLAHVSAAALRHKYAILEHELRLQKSLSEECEDLGVDSPSASELFPEAELLFANSPAHEHNQEHHSHTPQPLQSSIPQPDMDDQIATDHLIPREIDVSLGLGDVGIVAVSEDGSATIALDQEEFARSHPNTTFHSEPTDGEVQPFTITGLKGRHITSTIFHSNSAPATVLMTAPQATVISQAPEHSVKYEIENMINTMPSSHNNDINLSSVLVKDDGLTRFDNILTDSRELHLTNTTSAIVHSSGNATQVIRRVCYEDDKRERDARYLIDEPDNLIAGDDAKMVAEDSSRDATLESMADVDDDRSSPERHAELFWESNSASERSESRRPLDFSSDSDKCCKSPSFDETNSTDSSGVGTHMRLDSVIKEARARARSGSADGSSADDAHPPLRTYPPKRPHHPLDDDRSLSGKTRAGERSPDGVEVRRRASGRGVVKRGCHCCNGEPAPPRPKKPRQRKPTLDFTNN